jgi:type-F conjugative transfer system secretin TraK
MLLLCASSYGLEIKAVKDNATVQSTVSSKSLNRIYVTTDRIAEVYGLEGAFKIEKDEVQGSIYLIPLGYFRNNPFNVFLRTEHGHNYGLLLTPEEIDAKTIAIKPLSPATLQARRWELSTPYEITLIKLVNMMRLHRTPDGYAVIELGSKHAIQNSSPLSYQLKTIYKGDNLEGQVWLVKNISKQSVMLNPNRFNDKRVLAASFDKATLMPDQVSELYWVKRHES